LLAEEGRGDSHGDRQQRRVLFFIAASRFFTDRPRPSVILARHMVG
jgi:hypothetical protein